MAGHDRGDPRLNAPAERDQLPLFQLFHRFFHPGQSQMGIYSRISMAWKMLTAAKYAGIFIGPNRSLTKGRHSLRIVTETANTDHRIGRIGVHIQHRGHIEVHAEAPELSNGDLGGNAGIFRLAGGCDGHSARDCNSIPRHTGNNAALLVNDNKSRIAGNFPNHCLNLVAKPPQLGSAFYIPAKQDHISDLIFPNQSNEFIRKFRAMKTKDQLLAQHLFCRQFHIISPWDKSRTFPSAAGTLRFPGCIAGATPPYPSWDSRTPDGLPMRK